MAAQNATISDGAITVTGSFCRLFGEGGLSDTLDTINGGEDGQHLVLFSSGDAITVSHGTGNIFANSGMGRTLNFGSDKAFMTLICVFDGEGFEWYETAFATNAGGA